MQANEAALPELFHLPLSILKQLRNNRLLPSIHTVLIPAEHYPDSAKNGLQSSNPNSYPDITK
jgi:hypothetical protein